MKKYISYLILTVAVGIGIYIVLEDQFKSASEESEALESYMEQNGIERERPQEEDMIGFDTLEETGVQPGMQAENFELPELDTGDVVRLNELQGNYVVVNMWATWCPPCRDEIPHFIEFYENYQDQNVEIVGINMTASERNIDTVEQFADDFQIPYYTLLDNEGVMEEAYEVYAMPSTYIIDPDGQVAMNRPGYMSYEVLEESFLEIQANYEEQAS